MGMNRNTKTQFRGFTKSIYQWTRAMLSFSLQESQYGWVDHSHFRVQVQEQLTWKCIRKWNGDMQSDKVKNMFSENAGSEAKTRRKQSD